MNRAQHSISKRSQLSRGRNWLPIVDQWIGTSDTRIWQHDDSYDFDWSSTDPWTRRITQS